MVLASVSNVRVGQKLRVVRGGCRSLPENAVVEVRAIVNSAVTKNGNETGLLVAVNGKAKPTVWNFDRFRLLRRRHAD